MIRRLDISFARNEWLAVVCGLVAAGTVYWLLIHPSLRHVSGREQALSEMKQAEQQLEDARRQYEALRREITAREQELKQLGGSPPPAQERESQIARLTALAAECQLTVDKYQPIDSVELSDHQAFFVEFVGRGSFPAFQRFLHRVETEIDFVDTTHFALTSGDSQKDSTCSATWSCRINNMRTTTQAETPRMRKTASGAFSEEDRLNEP